MPVDPIQLTRQLVDIESTTYHEAWPESFFTNIFSRDATHRRTHARIPA